MRECEWFVPMMSESLSMMRRIEEPEGESGPEGESAGLSVMALM